MAGKDKYGFRDSFPRFFKPDGELKSKAGSGGPDTRAVADAQRYLDAVEIDVAPQIGTYLMKLQLVVDEVRAAPASSPDHLPRLTKPIMNVKATAGMFGEMMLCRVSALLLTFLEDVRKLDAEVMHIVDAYFKVAKTVILLKIRSETDPRGQILLVEIRNACKRYHGRHSQGGPA